MQAFYELACERSRMYQTYEFMSMMHGYCTLALCQSLGDVAGQRKFTAWVGKLITESSDARHFPQNPSTAYVHRDPVETLHHILGVKDSQGLDYQAFLDLLQRSGEEKGLMDLMNEELDDYVPLEIVSAFALSMVKGMLKVMADIYPTEGDPK
mmetsp:Transcript_2315/g.5480  ORF Transcript_2315/g.5480 Transcript_2315/m.5480 type:complete len:153 (+) Transcript_2315:100-558(+)